MKITLLEIEELIRSAKPAKPIRAPGYRDVTPAPPDITINCINCGACCAEYFYISAKGATLNDVDRNHYVNEDDNMRLTKNKRCTALYGAIGTKVACAIYDTRPTVCRKYAPESKECLRARASHAIGRISPEARTKSTKKTFEVHVDGLLVARITPKTIFIAAGPGTNFMIYSNPVKEPHESIFFPGIWQKFVQQVHEHHFVCLDGFQIPAFLPA